MQQLSVLLFEDFETLDVFGPVEVFGRLKDHYTIRFFSLAGGIVENGHGVKIITEKLEEIKGGTDMILIPGGYGTRQEVHNTKLIALLRSICVASKYVFTVCTGTALLAKTGLLDGRKATSNKRAFDWVVEQSDKVEWVRKARWVVDWKYYTSSGVSAGIDMSLGFLSDQHGVDFARDTAYRIEYSWTEDKEHDEFV